MLFISYSHENEEFVNRLIAQLLKERVAIWWDRIGIKVGESLLEKIQGAITEADYLAIVLSKASVESVWCKEELNAGLMRQLAERRVFVLPILMEPCETPIFLRDKKYANFSVDFDTGFQELREAIASVAEISTTKTEDDEYITDSGIEWYVRNDDRIVVEVDGVSFSKNGKYSVMTRIEILGNDVATRRYKEYWAANLKEEGMAMIIASSQAIFDVPDAHVSLYDKSAKLAQAILDEKTGIRYDFSIWARLIGESPGTYVLYHFGAIFGNVLSAILEKRPQLNDEQKRRLVQILLRKPS